VHRSELRSLPAFKATEATKLLAHETSDANQLLRRLDPSGKQCPIEWSTLPVRTFCRRNNEQSLRVFIIDPAL